MRGGILSKFCVADENHDGFRRQNQRQQKPVLRDDGVAQNPRGAEDEQIINNVGNAVEAAQRGRGHAEAAREDAVKNVRERAGDEQRQINPARNICERTNQCDRAEQQAQQSECEWKAFHFCKIAVANFSSRVRFSKNKKQNLFTVGF